MRHLVVALVAVLLLVCICCFASAPVKSCHERLPRWPFFHLAAEHGLGDGPSGDGLCQVCATGWHELPGGRPNSQSSRANVIIEEAQSSRATIDGTIWDYQQCVTDASSQAAGRATAISKRASSTRNGVFEALSHRGRLYERCDNVQRPHRRKRHLAALLRGRVPSTTGVPHASRQRRCETSEL